MTLPIMVLVASLAPPAVAASMPQETEPSQPPQEAEAAEPLQMQEAESGETSASPNAAEGLIDEGLQAFDRRRYREAEETFRKALAADPSSADAAFYLGYTLYKIAEPSRRLTPEKREAAQMFAKAYDLDPGFRPVWAEE